MLDIPEPHCPFPRDLGGVLKDLGYLSDGFSLQNLKGGSWGRDIVLRAGGWQVAAASLYVKATEVTGSQPY